MTVNVLYLTWENHTDIIGVCSYLSCKNLWHASEDLTKNWRKSCRLFVNQTLELIYRTVILSNILCTDRWADGLSVFISLSLISNAFLKPLTLFVVSSVLFDFVKVLFEFFDSFHICLKQLCVMFYLFISPLWLHYHWHLLFCTGCIKSTHRSWYVCWSWHICPYP